MKPNIKDTRFNHAFITIALTVIFGQFYFNPFNSEFRITLGVIALTFLLIYFEDISIIRTAFLTGVSVFVFRSILFVNGNGELGDIFSKYLPSAGFYFSFGVMLHLFNIRNKMQYPFAMFFILSFVDITSNLVEITLRLELLSIGIDAIVSKIFVTGFFRGFISLILYWTFYTMKDLALAEEKRKERENLFMLYSKITCERYYLAKSMQDIEETMEASHAIYLQIKDSSFGMQNPDLSRKLISLSNNIHDIKKDYRRILLGLEEIVPDLRTKDMMPIKEVFYIVMETNQRFDRLIEKNLILTGSCSTTLYTKSYLSLTSIMNNLINNAIEASEKNGKIFLTIEETQNRVILKVEDNGTGISPKNRDLIFNPGFSTKYDPQTGKMSTGVGLTHVKNLVTDIFEGEIDFETRKGKGTTFIVSMPLFKFCKSETNQS
ncbi:MAG: sensor histidine kinase [Tissierellales bacterium]|nr:sensor histidine kinase [Tissierellales bacterium]MBN2827296.1 sensor histidine kinase [Tissierellales bacterium]